MQTDAHAGGSGGYIALMSVLLVSGLFIVLALQGNVQVSMSTRAEIARTLYEEVLVSTHTCAEQALIALASDVAYAGGTHTVDGVTCEITQPTGHGSHDRSMQVSGTVQQVTVVFDVVVADLNQIGSTATIAIRP
jgi:hypothetical protein